MMVTLEAKARRGEFANEPLINFSAPENGQAMEEALKKVAGQLGRGTGDGKTIVGGA